MPLDNKTKLHVYKPCPFGLGKVQRDASSSAGSYELTEEVLKYYPCLLVRENHTDKKFHWISYYFSRALEQNFY